MKTTNHIHAGSGEIHSRDTEKYDDIKLLNRNMLLRKCVEDHIRDDDGNILIAMTDIYLDTTLWCEVVRVSEHCKEVRPELLEAYTVYMSIPEFEGRGFSRISNELFVISEELMDKKNPLLKPFVYLEAK